MSFKQNENNHMIHLGNYEEFFILYMDNELTEEQRLQVEEFLEVHPGLRIELETLMSTKLPTETLRIDKTELMAENMKVGSVDEELLLYIDNELPADKKKIVALEISSNPVYQLRHRLLKKATLDANERINYPNKEELYHRSGRIIGLGGWMRIAAAVLVIGSLGVLYFVRNAATPSNPVDVAQHNGQKQLPAVEQKIVLPPAPETQEIAVRPQETKAAAPPSMAEKMNHKKPGTPATHPQLAVGKTTDMPLVAITENEVPKQKAMAVLSDGAPKIISGTITAFNPTALT